MTPLYREVTKERGSIIGEGNPMSPIRVVLADDHPVVRSGIRNLLERAVDITVVGEASTGGEALQLVEELSPDILLLDMELPDLKGSKSPNS